MRQRAALIRTLALNPEILLLDEPFSALDYQTRLTVSDDIGRIIRENKKTAILVTHNISEAIRLADRILVFSNRPATIKRRLDVSLTITDSSPVGYRNAVEFNEYFNEIWEDLCDETNQKEK
jgi:NitT/TauT family transport system ATP-binding protein